MNQLLLFDIEQFNQYDDTQEPPDPDDYPSIQEYETAWNEWEKQYPHLVAAAQGMTVLEQESKDTQPAANDDSTVLEQAQADTNQVAPEQCHWVEKYKVTRYNKEHYYYRYVWMEGRKLHHVHIGGGNIKSAIAIARKEKVEMAIADGQTPIEIKQMLRSNNA